MYRSKPREYWTERLKLASNYKVDAVVVCGNGNRRKIVNAVETVLKAYKLDAPIENLEYEFFSSVQVIKLNGKTIWFDVVYGGAYLSELLHVANLLGSERNILTGIIGGLRKGGKNGDIIIPEFSYGEESSTKIYARDVLDDRHYPDAAFSERVFSLIDKSFNPTRGSIITCQAMLGETWEDVLRWSEEGYAGVEMETATFFAVSNHFHVPSTALLHIADNLIEQEDMGSEVYKLSETRRDEARDHIFYLAFEFASQMK